MTRFNFSNKYRAKKTYSELCGRTFDSKAEARRGEELAMLEKQGAIKDLKYQVPFTLHEKPSIKIKIDFQYYDKESKQTVYEDTKGVLTREARIKLAWLHEKFDIRVYLTS